MTVLPPLPWTLAAVSLVLLLGLAVPTRPTAVAPIRAGGSLFATRWAGAGALAALSALAATARFGPRSTLDNPVPALVVGLLLPLLVLVPLVVLLVVRPLGRPPVTDVWPAAPVVLLVGWFLFVSPDRFDPRALAPAIGGYAVVMVAVGLAFGGAAVQRTEVFGLLARWCSLGPGLASWAPPAGAGAVLGVVLGGAWYERAARSVGAPGTGRLLAGSVALALLVAFLLRWRDAVPALVPLAAAAVVAGGLRRALISAQLLAQRDGVVADPLGMIGGQVASLVVVVVGGCAAAAVVARRAGPAADRLAGLAMVAVASALTAFIALRP